MVANPPPMLVRASAYLGMFGCSDLSPRQRIYIASAHLLKIITVCPICLCSVCLVQLGDIECRRTWAVKGNFVS